jgi:nitrite reductase (cytochrome c-552)
MTTPPRQPAPRRVWLLIGGAFLVGALVMGAIAALLVSIQGHKADELEFPFRVVAISPTELDPAVWGKNFPRQYDSFVKTKDDTIQTPYAGSVPFDKLERYPSLPRIWAGYPFAEDYRNARGHYYALIDQKETKRQLSVRQPGACANCHAAEAPLLIAEMGWENFNATPYEQISDRLHLGTSCADCHDPDTMALRITRPAFVNAMAERGIDLDNATRQEMRTYVCAQCHVEYYFRGDQKILTFPWRNGLEVEAIEQFYNDIGFRDWVHKESGAPMIKIQHPEYELWSTGVHARSGVGCSDCHMPYIRDGAVKVSDHWVRSPLVNINQACQTCHKQDAEELRDRVVQTQDRTAELLRRTEQALVEAIDAMMAAKAAGVTDEELEQAGQYHRAASLRWDFVFSENSIGFHSPQEAARILAGAIDNARLAQLEAERLRGVPR